MDKIFIEQLEVETIIGIYDWERKMRQMVVFDLEMAADIRRAAETDAVEDTINYKKVSKRISQFVSESEFQLIEALAEQVAAIILNEFNIQSVRVRLSKPGALSDSKNVGVEIERSQA